LWERNALHISKDEEVPRVRQVPRVPHRSKQSLFYVRELFYFQWTTTIQETTEEPTENNYNCAARV
jgi:hypothetical protein